MRINTVEEIVCKKDYEMEDVEEHFYLRVPDYWL